MPNKNGPSLERVNVVGTSGSGKSTFARALSEKLNISYIEMDQLFWEPHWTEASDEVFFEKLKQAISGQRWVLDGNYSRTTKLKWERVTTVIWIDFTFRRTLYQAVKRAVIRSLTRKELWQGTGNRESFWRSFFSKKSIVLWTFQTYDTVVSRYDSVMKDPQYRHISFIRLKSPREARIFLGSLS